MKKKTYLFALMAMVLTLGSCSDNENGIGGETSKYITVSTSIGNMTRVATDVIQTKILSQLDFLLY